MSHELRTPLGVILGYTDLMSEGEQARLDIIWQAADPPSSLHTDKGKLKIILKNLLGNALKFTSQGCITMRAQHRDVGVEFCVTDTRIGISQDAYAVILSRFSK